MTRIFSASAPGRLPSESDWKLRLFSYDLALFAKRGRFIQALQL
jgi:hypothetical protein